MRRPLGVVLALAPFAVAFAQQPTPLAPPPPPAEVQQPNGNGPTPLQPPAPPQTEPEAVPLPLPEAPATQPAPAAPPAGAAPAQPPAPAEGQPPPAQGQPAPPGQPAAPGQPTAPAAPQPAPAPVNIWLPQKIAELVALDKVTSRATHLTVPVGQSTSFVSLTIAVRACDIRPPDQPADAAAFLDITDSHKGAPDFHGWMLLSVPSVSMLQHPIYDVRLLGCHD